MPKELQNHLKAKRPTARGRMGVFRDSGGKWDPGREGELGHRPTRPRGADLLRDKASKGPRHGRSNISPLSNEHILYFYIYNNNIESFLFFFLWAFFCFFGFFWFFLRCFVGISVVGVFFLFVFCWFFFFAKRTKA